MVKADYQQLAVQQVAQVQLVQVGLQEQVVILKQVDHQVLLVAQAHQVL